jgi:hypothetical protein
LWFLLYTVYAGAMLSTLLAVFLSVQSVAQRPAPKSLDTLNFIVGRWEGQGTGAPGQSQGEFSFDWDLTRSILVRKSFAAYPATGDRPASRHDDLMIVFVEDDKLRADYFDSEAHVIHYKVTVAPDSKSVEFLSDPFPDSPRYRLIYRYDSRHLPRRTA